MKDSPAIILASGLAGLAGVWFPTAQGWILDQSLTVMDTEISAHSLGFFNVSKFLFLPSLLVAILGALTMLSKRCQKRSFGLATCVFSLGTLGAWYLQKVTVEHFSVVGVGPALGLFLLLVSGLGGLIGGGLMVAWPPKHESAS